MPRWMRMLRGMLGTGITFALGVGVPSAIVALVASLAGAGTMAELLGMAARLSVVSFLVGIVFAGFLAFTARAFDDLSLRFVAALGAAGGFAFFLFLGFHSGFNAWSITDAIANFSILLLMGAGVASALLLGARKARRALTPAHPPQSLGAGNLDDALAREQMQQARGVDRSAERRRPGL